MREGLHAGLDGVDGEHGQMLSHTSHSASNHVLQEEGSEGGLEGLKGNCWWAYSVECQAIIRDRIVCGDDDALCGAWIPHDD